MSGAVATPVGLVGVCVCVCVCVFVSQSKYTRRAAWEGVLFGTMGTNECWMVCWCPCQGTSSYWDFGDLYGLRFHKDIRCGSDKAGVFGRGNWEAEGGADCDWPVWGHCPQDSGELQGACPRSLPFLPVLLCIDVYVLAAVCVLMQVLCTGTHPPLPVVFPRIPTCHNATDPFPFLSAAPLSANTCVCR